MELLFSLPDCGYCDDPVLWMLSTSLKSKGALMQIPIEWIPQIQRWTAIGWSSPDFLFEGNFK